MSGVFGIALNRDCWEELKSGAALLQPRGDEWGGISVLNKEGIRSPKPERGKIIPFFEKLETTEPTIKDSQTAIAHVSQKDPQPVTIEETKFGPIALAFNGKILNREELQKPSDSEETDTEILARLVGEGKDPLDGIKKIYQKVKGPFSLVLLTCEGLFAARDPLGIRPLVIGRVRGEEIVGCAVASESIALTHIGINIERDVRPGEIIKVETVGFGTLDQISSPGLKICSFEFGYWARPSSVIEGTSVGLARYNMGMKLAPTCPLADVIAGLPMSGNTAAHGCHYASKIPFRDIFDFNIEAGGRSFIPLSPRKRAKRAKEKLLIMAWAVVGMIVVVVDDSIVEGNQTIARIFLAKRAGAKEVHLRIASPLMKYPCPFDVTPRGELLAAYHSEEEMKKILGVESLAFNTIEDYAEAIISAQSKERRKKNPLRFENFCFGCFTKEYPLELPSEFYLKPPS